jgi:8-oxo-dGTP pyrophosphatase MutT (NUDIX family)
MIFLKKNGLKRMLFKDLISQLQSRLREPLPGLKAQLTMTSSTRIRELMDFSVPGDAVPSSVLLLLYPVMSDVFTVFIQRPNYEGIHSGQISLPGGKAEAGDSDPAATALREAREEIGIDPGEVTILGKLTDLYIPPSNFLVSPYIGYSASRPAFVPDPGEVVRTVEVKLADLFSDLNKKEVTLRIRGGVEITAWAYVINKDVIWGATAMIVAEFSEIVNKL